MYVLMLILQSFYFLLPAAFANMAPVFYKKVRFLNYPVDFNSKIRGKEIFGKNKTWRGVFFGIVLSIVIVFVERELYVYGYFTNISVIDYGETSFLLLGFLLGLGAAFGDLAESFIKRRFSFSPGESLYFFDQTDWIIGSFIFSLFVFTPKLELVLVSLLLFFGLHVLVKHIGYMFKLEDKKW